MIMGIIEVGGPETESTNLLTEGRINVDVLKALVGDAKPSELLRDAGF